MCPLRIILIFLSATLAGFFVLRNIKSPSITSDAVAGEDDSESSPVTDATCEGRSSSKISAAFVNGFWTCVDMASGRYLWKNLISVSRKAD